MRGCVVTVLRDDKDRLAIDAGEGTLTVTPISGGMKIRAGGLTGATVVHIDREDAIALRDWINAAITVGALR